MRLPQNSAILHFSQSRFYSKACEVLPFPIKILSSLPLKLNYSEMKKIVLSLLGGTALLTACEQPETTAMTYPETRQDTTVTDEYFGTVVNDPYRWLEDDYSEESMDWVSRQNKFTHDYINNIPQRSTIKKRLTELWNYERFTTPFSKGGKKFYFKNDGTQNQNVLYQITEEGDKVVLNPNTFSEDGTVALGAISFSKDGKYLAYEVSSAGSDWHSIKIMEMESGKLLEEVIEWVKFSGIAWQGNAFYYSAYDAPVEGDEFSGKNEFHKVYYHEVGTPAANDKLVYEDKENAQRNFYASTSENEEFVVVFGAESTSGNSVHVKKQGGESFRTFDANFDYEYSLVNADGDDLYFFTNNGAPNNRIVRLDTKNEKIIWAEFVPEKEHVLSGFEKIGNGYLAQYTEDVVSTLYKLNSEGKEESKVQLPGIGTLGSLSYLKDENTVYYSFENYTQPSTIYSLNEKLETTVFKQPELDFDATQFETKQVFYTSKDGTKIPMFITHKKGITLDGSNPTFLYAYGGFNIAINPNFKNYMTVFLENGGVYAVANIRGGSEYGEKWHEQGTKLQKQNVFDDYITAAEYLISEKYTNSDKLAVHGRSNGGLLIGAVMTQRPDLFEVCLPGVGVLDMLRYHQFTIGWAWAGDYGRSDDDEANFKNLYGYSPLHNVKDIEYPATLVTTGDHDDRVVPAHSFKFAANLQAHQKGVEPTLIRIDVNAGHGAGKPVAKQIDEWSDVMGFVFHHLEMK
jgi:prolyl oligopeptidase